MFLPTARVTRDCEDHPEKIVKDLMGNYSCVTCCGQKITDRCPRCHHDGKKEMIAWNTKVDAQGVHESDDCKGCGKERYEGAVRHDGRTQWLVEPESLGDKFRWQAKRIAFRVAYSEALPPKVAQTLSGWIYETFLTERRPGRATVIGRVHRGPI